MNPIEAYKPLGLISIILIWTSLIYLLHKWRGHKGMSISKHVAASRQAYLTLAIVETVLIPVFLIFIFMWFAPTFQLPDLFTLCIVLSMAGFLFAAWLPDTAGKQSFAHSFAAYIAASLLIPATALLGISQLSSPFARVFTTAVLFYQIVSLGLFFSTPKAKAYHLYIQSSYLFLFDVAILITAYVR